MSGYPFRDRAAICGVGETAYSRDSGVSTLTLALRAIVAALHDAGLEPSDVDGVACHRVGDSVQAALVAESLGIGDLRYFVDQFGGGSASHSIVGQAAMAVVTGQADTVVCWRAINARSEWRMGGTGRAAPDTIEFQYQVPYGYATPPQQFAMAARAWMHDRDVGERDLGAVAVTTREHALRNPAAMQRKPLTMEEYLASRWVVEPFRLFDCCLETDAAVAVVVTTTERARHLAKVPVTISGAVWGSGQTLLSNGRDFTVTGAAAAARRLWQQAGFGPSDLDVAELYDAFTPLVLVQLEDYGIVGRGEAAGFVRDGGTRLDGTLPTNTHGGHLSAGYVHGLNHLAEAVRQLRGDLGERQVAGAESALSTGQCGYVAGNTSALALRRLR